MLDELNISEKKKSRTMCKKSFWEHY